MLVRPGQRCSCKWEVVTFLLNGGFRGHLSQISDKKTDLDREVRNPGDVAVVVRPHCVEGGGLGEGEEQTETGNKQNLQRKVVFKVCSC